MADEGTDELVNMQVRERLRQTDLEIRADVLHNKVKGRLTDDGVNQMLDSLSIAGFKVVRK